VIPAQTGGHRAQHLIGDVQRFGLLSAAAVVDRYTEIIDRATRDGSLRLAPLAADERGADWWSTVLPVSPRRISASLTRPQR
jgi:hypothetical protein